MSQKYFRTTEPIETQLEKSQALISQLNENVRFLKSQNNTLTTALIEAETKASSVDVLMKAVGENSLVRDAWEKFMMTLRLTGYDEGKS